MIGRIQVNPIHISIVQVKSKALWLMNIVTDQHFAYWTICGMSVCVMYVCMKYGIWNLFCPDINYIPCNLMIKRMERIVEKVGMKTLEWKIEDKIKVS